MPHIRALRVALSAVLLFAWGGCSPGRRGGDDDDEADGDSDSDTDTDTDGDGGAARSDGGSGGDGDADADGGNPYVEPDAGSLGCESVVDDGCGDTEVCGDGLDNDCNGHVDEGCSCENGTSQACFRGPPGRRGIGGCLDGTQVCHGFEFPEWTECEGGVSSEAEICDGKDNDCNGCIDDISDCQPEITCPVDDTAPPLQEYTLDASTMYDGTPQSCHWDVDCPLGSACPGPADPNDCSTTVYLDVSGDYTVHVTIVDENGNELECSYIVHVVGGGLRVELSWNGPDDDDVDLHLHRNENTGWFDDDDCYWSDCGETTGSYSIDWGYADTVLADCPDPPAGSGWDYAARGSCPNPRLDIDDVDGFGPENINLDNPAPFDEFRVLVHYYDGGIDGFGGATADATVRVYCGGVLKGQFGAATITSEGAGVGDLWRVVDVVMDAAGEDCDVTAIDRNGDYDVRAYGTRNNF
jgi:hypothetical protein